jgi:hypothetical protein
MMSEFIKWMLADRRSLEQTLADLIEKSASLPSPPLARRPCHGNYR